MSRHALALLAACLVLPTVAAQQPTTFAVAHRGASAYRPEHTIAAYQLALDQGAEYIEQDLGLTKDGVLVCLHDLSLERTTDVEERFPERATTVTLPNGQTRKMWFVDDFTLAEVKSLDAGSWFDPSFAGARVATFQEAIDLVKGKAGIFPELREPVAFSRHRSLSSMAHHAGASPEADELPGGTMTGHDAVWLATGGRARAPACLPRPENRHPPTLRCNRTARVSLNYFRS